MKLSKLYSNKPKLFPDITFNKGLNVMLGEIRDPKNRKKTTHNIGKTTFIRIIDFCLLKGISQYSFWRKKNEIFKDFEFYLEISYDKGFLTLKRSFLNDTKVSIKQHLQDDQDFRKNNVSWDHSEISYENAKKILDGYFDFDIIKPWDYRKITSYLLRTQGDYDDVFRLDKHAGRDIDWKPPLVQILGLDGQLVHKAYETDEQIIELENKISFLEKRVFEFKDDPDRLNGLIQVNHQEIDNFEQKLQNFDFKEVEDEINKELVDDIENQISDLNTQKYYLNLDISSIKNSLEIKNNFSLKKTQKLFNEAGIYFGEQIVKDYGDLLDFNQKITRERKKYLKIELSEKEESIAIIEEKLDSFNALRKESLSKIKERETFNKYKKLGNKLAEQKLILLNLESIRDDLKSLQIEKEKLDGKKEARKDITRNMDKVLNNPSKRYLDIKSSYNKFIKSTLNKSAIITTKINSSGNYTFNTPFIDKDGLSTSEDDGHTFKKLQCIAFDAAIVSNSVTKKFPHFIIHDGVLETIENRTKLNLLEVFKELTQKNVQVIITVLDSHLPTLQDGSEFSFDVDEVIRILHDKGEDGLLFKMPSW